jgi:hypothetical protein
MLPAGPLQLIIDKLRAGKPSIIQYGLTVGSKICGFNIQPTGVFYVFLAAIPLFVGHTFADLTGVNIFE